jgi:hypothetical protein
MCLQPDAKEQFMAAKAAFQTLTDGPVRGSTSSSTRQQVLTLWKLCVDKVKFAPVAAVLWLALLLQASLSIVYDWIMWHCIE